MTKSAKLLHSICLALALIVSAPIMGKVLLFGVAEAQAQTVEGVAVSSIQFDGNSRFNDNQLLAMVEVSSRPVYTQAGIANDVRTIETVYSQAGYSNITVSARPEAAADGSVRVVFTIDEGGRAGIAAINFTGNNAMSSSVLKNVITTNETHLLSWLFRDDEYSEDRLAFDRERIRLYYANRGYPDARVLSSVAQFDAERNAYFINFTIEEGQRYNFGNIAIETSIPGLNADGLRGGIQTGRGSVYSLSDLGESTQNLTVRATNQGFPFAEVRARVDRDIDNRLFNVTYLVDEGPRVYVERINITGNTKTRDHVVRREFEFGEGDPFNRTLVTRGRANIEALGFFSAVQVTAAPGSAPDRVILNVAVVERSTGEYGLGAGYSTRDGIFGEISITERNFLGRGQYVRAAIGRSEVGETYDFSFTEPRFMGLRIAAGVDLYRRVQQPGTFTYGTESTGGRLRFALPVAENLTFATRIGYEQRSFSGDVPPYIGGDTRDSLTVGYTLSYDTLDNAQRPTRGIVASFSQDYTTLTSDFLTTEVRVRAYYPVWEEFGLVGSIRGQAGVVTDLDGGGIHPSDAFQLGPNLVRGYSYGGMGARTVPTGGFGSNPTGILAYAGLSAELEFPVPLIPETWGLRGALWGDLGWIDGVPDTSGVSVYDIETALKSSVGASIIWDSPLGPLRGDFAHVIDPDERDRTQVFQLTLSTLF